MSCLFCGIVEKKISSSVVYESEEVLGFKDLHPQAPVHLLFVPKRHIAGAHALDGSSRGVVDDLVFAANQAAREHGVADSGYRLVINCREHGGQTVDHLHLHLLGGRKMTWPPG